MTGRSSPHPEREHAEAPCVLFVGGYARSGSTVLDRALGSDPAFASCGEVRFLWRRGFLEDQRCGCGERFGACAFWTAVTETAYGDRAGADPERVATWQARFDQWWRVPEILRGPRSAADRAELEAYLDHLGALYRGIAGVSGCRVIVDSSKDASYGYLLAAMGARIDLRVVHLVRDPRAVAHSLSDRRKFDPGNDGTIGGHALAHAASAWSVSNALVRRLRRSSPYLLVRYERFADDPATTLDEIARLTGATAWHPEDRAEPAHIVAGNPVRFERGPLTIRRDDRWRTEMRASRRTIVTALTWPSLRRYR